MTGLFQKVNHLGKSELTGSAGYAIEEGKNDHFPLFPKALKNYIVFMEEKQNSQIQNFTITTSKF